MATKTIPASRIKTCDRCQCDITKHREYALITTEYRDETETLFDNKETDLCKMCWEKFSEVLKTFIDIGCDRA